ncbi:MAG: methionyl-tRNA formyltransferase [Bacillota bacterium]
MASLSLVFLGSAPFALPSLRQLLQGGYSPVAAVTRPDRPAGRGKKMTATPVKEEAQEHHLDVYQPESKGQLLEILHKLQPQLLINVAYGMILPDAVLALPPWGCLNLHPSLLPRYRGAAPIQRALMAGESVTGVTLMYMAVRLDAGDIILQEPVAVEPEDNFGTLHDRLANTGAALLLQGLNLLTRGQAPRVPQDDKLATFAPPLSREEEEINWSDPAEKIFNLVRALAPFPGAFTRFRGMRLKIWKTGLPQPVPEGLEGEATGTVPGKICHIGTASLAVYCGSGILPLLEVQPESKRRIDARSFVQGYRLQVGESFA